VLLPTLYSRIPTRDKLALPGAKERHPRPPRLDDANIITPGAPGGLREGGGDWGLPGEVVLGSLGQRRGRLHEQPPLLAAVFLQARRGGERLGEVQPFRLAEATQLL